jgi:hypothetical protein
MVNGAIREQSIVCSVRIFGTSGIAPHTACRIPDRAVRGDRAAGADPGPAQRPQTSYNLYDAYRAASARPCARPTRAGPIVLACDGVRTQVRNGSRSLFVRADESLVSSLRSADRIALRGRSPVVPRVSERYSSLPSPSGAQEQVTTGGPQ